MKQTSMHIHIHQPKRGWDSRGVGEIDETAGYKQNVEGVES